MTQKTDHQSDLAKALGAVVRPTKILPANLAISVLKEQVHKIAFRVPTLAEDRDAVNRAYAMVKSTCASEEARQDGDVLTNAKLVAALFHACREVKITKDPIGVEREEVGAYPAFPSPEWMYDHMTADQVGVLCNTFAAVRAEMSPFKAFDVDAAETILRVTGEQPDDDAPGALFAPFSREGLVSLLTYAARCLAGARGALTEAESAPEGHRIVDVEHEALLMQERAAKETDAAKAAAMKERAAALLGAVGVLRGERPASSLAESS